jgi:small Trp-rich protein
MYFLGIGLVLLLMKYFGMDPVSHWNWWLVLLPFGLAILWWTWADWSGYTKRVAMDREGARRQARADKIQQALGSTTKKPRR